ncbi:MAG TPA: hypothetical protein PLF40_12980, partial [Kofleriaceae bacterium]|nr:hypothetical protein [Kofleriaceae bacterium]
MTYDAGDRLLTKTLAPRALSAADQTLFGASTVKYTWDYGGNRMGRLRYTQSYGPSTTVPTVVTDYQYDAMGHTTFVNHTFKGAGYNFTRQFGANYTPWGGVRYTYYRDYVGGANET